MSVCGDSEDLAPSNPFLETEEKETPLDVALQVLQVLYLFHLVSKMNFESEDLLFIHILLYFLQNITARRTPNFYNITNQRGKVVRFCLFKNSYKLGEDIVGTFDFSATTVPCVQVSISHFA